MEIISKEDYINFFNKNTITEKEWNDYLKSKEMENNSIKNYHFFNTLVFNETETNKNEISCIY